MSPHVFWGALVVLSTLGLLWIAYHLGYLDGRAKGHSDGLADRNEANVRRIERAIGNDRQ